MKTEPDPLVGDAVALEAVGQKEARRGQKLGVLPTHDDPLQRSRLAPAPRRPVRLDHEAARRIDPQAEAVAPEPVHRNGDADVPQKCTEERGVLRVVPA